MSYRRCLLVIVCYVYTCVVSAIDTSSYHGFGGFCNETTACDSDTFECRHYEGCNTGMCACKPGRFFNMSSNTCTHKALPPAEPHQPCNTLYGCKGGLVCHKCEFGEEMFSQPVCRRASYPMDGHPQGNLTYGSRCNATAECASTLYCYKSEDCDIGMCKCQPGMKFIWPEKPCIAFVYPFGKDAKLGEKCLLVHGKSNCNDHLTCTICPGSHEFTCAGQSIKYTTKTNTESPIKPEHRKSSSANPKVELYIYVTIPVICIVGCVVVGIVIVRRRRFHRAGFRRTAIWSGVTNPIVNTRTF